MLRKLLLKVIVPIAFLFVISPNTCEAHQPRLVTTGLTEISNPEVSQAFYGNLNGTNQFFHLKSNKQFNLYVGIVLPDNKSANRQISAEIYQLKNNQKTVISSLDGTKHTWVSFYEEFGQDNYLRGPAYKSPDSTDNELKGNLLPAGDYYIRVFSPNNQGKYSLVTGYLELFPPQEIINALFVVPQLKVTFFNYPFIGIASSPYIFGPIISIVLFILLIRSIILKTQKKAKIIKTKSIKHKTRNRYSVKLKQSLGTLSVK